MPVNISAKDAARLGLAPPIKGKFNASPLVVDGHRFASNLEARHYGTLLYRLKAGEIADLELQPRYPLLVDGAQIGVYVADFRFRDTKTGGVVVQDAKGLRTSIFVRSKKHMRAQYGIDVEEVS